MSGASTTPAGSNRIVAWRIVTRKFASTAFSGAGARLYGGRWNSIGVSMIYTSGSIALAILEWRVHLAQWPAPPIVIIPIEIHRDLVWTPAKLPGGWNRIPAPSSVAVFGDVWIRSQRSAVMRVPSAVVPKEWNYLLNPTHPDFQQLKIGKLRLLRPHSRLGPLG